VRITGRLSHPSIVHIYEMGARDDGTLYYTMPLVRGRTLAEEIRRRGTLQERLRLIPHFDDLCHGIAYAHSQGVLHRDLKPENVMVGPFGETVVLDWGLAKVTRPASSTEARGEAHGDGEEEALTAAGMTVGTPAYMSPEQAAGQLAEVDERSDVWGLGTVLYALLTGHAPFEGDSTAALVERVLTARYVPVTQRARGAPPELVAMVDRCLQRDRRHRYQSVRALQADLRAHRARARVETHAYGRWGRLREWAAQHRWLLFCVSALLLAIAVALGSLLR
jgi:serine/threonine-protein kinase